MDKGELYKAGNKREKRTFEYTLRYEANEAKRVEAGKYKGKQAGQSCNIRFEEEPNKTLSFSRDIIRMRGKRVEEEERENIISHTWYARL